MMIYTTSALLESFLTTTFVLQHVEALEILLQGLCGVNKEQLRIHELCLKSSPNLGNLLTFRFLVIFIVAFSYLFLYIMP